MPRPLRIHCRPLFVVALVAVTAPFASWESSVASAQEWTRFRGPNGTGVSEAKGIPTSWKESDYNWKATLPAGGHSSPVIWQDLIFLTGADDEANRRSVFAVSTTTGQILWTRDYPLQVHKRHKLNSFASPTCAVDAERVYASWTTPAEYTVKAFTHDGREVWSRDLGAFVSQHSGGVSPVIFEDLLSSATSRIRKVAAPASWPPSIDALAKPSGNTSATATW